MNNVSLIGRLTADPELRHTQSGVATTRFSIAVDRRVKTGEERQADFINIVAWNQRAEMICKYFSKGQRIGITGSIRTGSYTAQDGTKRYTSVIQRTVLRHHIVAIAMMVAIATATGSLIVRNPLPLRHILTDRMMILRIICPQMKTCPFN